MLLYILYIIIHFGKERRKISSKAITINPLELLDKDISNTLPSQRNSLTEWVWSWTRPSVSLRDTTLVSQDSAWPYHSPLLILTWLPSALGLTVFSIDPEATALSLHCLHSQRRPLEHLKRCLMPLFPSAPIDWWQTAHRGAHSGLPTFQGAFETPMHGWTCPSYAWDSVCHLVCGKGLGSWG